MKQRKKEKNSNWKGGITSLNKQIRNLPKMEDWKREVFERDNYRDWFSGCKGQLEVHHIKSFKKILNEYNIKSIEDALNCKELWDINNGITMLKSSHKFHHVCWGK
jgi:hypothetical protein